MEKRYQSENLAFRKQEKMNGTVFIKRCKTATNPFTITLSRSSLEQV